MSFLSRPPYIDYLYYYQKSIGQNHRNAHYAIAVYYKENTPHKVGKAYIQ